VLTRSKQAPDGPMTVECAQRAPCQYTLRASLSAAAIQPVRDMVVREFQREATLAGFRKGKAPRELVERHHQAGIREELVRRLSRQVLEQATTQQSLKPVSPFEVTKLDFDEAKGMTLEAQVEVEPEFRLAEYRRVPLAKPPVTVTPEELTSALGQLQESMAELVPVPRPQASGSLAEDQPKEKRLPNLDDEFAKDVGFETLEQLRQHLEAKLREHKQQEQARAVEHALCEALLARHPFEVPQQLVGRQVERLTRDFHARLLLMGMTEEQVAGELTTYTEQLKQNAVRQVKLAFVLDRIADQEKLSVTQDEVVERLWRLSRQWNKDPAEVRRLLDAKGLWPSVLSSIRQEKTIGFLLSVAQVDEVTSGH